MRLMAVTSDLKVADARDASSMSQAIAGSPFARTCGQWSGALNRIVRMTA